MNDIHSLSHTKWCCKYHVVFAPKYRRKAFYGTRRIEIGSILRNLCEWKGVNILEGEVCIDHVHMLIEIPPKMLWIFIIRLKLLVREEEMSIKKSILANLSDFIYDVNHKLMGDFVSINNDDIMRFSKM